MLSAMTTSEQFSSSSRPRCFAYGTGFASPVGEDLLENGFCERTGDGDRDEVPRIEFESEISDLLDQLDFDDLDSKPKIDSGSLKLNISNSVGCDVTNYRSLDEFCRISCENRRASHHLSGGGLLSDSNLTATSRFCALSDGGCISTENMFNFDDLRPSGLVSQVSPSSPLTFDTAALTRGESTNPFNNSLKDVLDDEDSVFSPTNPFSSANLKSSPDYENLSVPKSFSQCSTRPASPEPSPSNPFLINASPVDLKRLFKDQQQNPVIFAVPVFPIFQHHMSTQTGEPEEPVYQNVTNQIQKFMQRNNHSEYDLQCLKTTIKDLRNSGWYYENVSWQESVVLLKNTEPGTFLIRDSSDPNFLFSLSVQTSRGPTSVRLHYVNGQFRLDAEEKLIPHMPSFNSVSDLVDYYIENTVKNKVTGKVRKASRKNGKDRLQKSKEQVWIDSQGNVYSNILLVKPLYRKEHFSTLQHLTRLAINRHMKKNLKNQINFKVTPVYESSPFHDTSFPADFSPVLNVDALPLPVTLLNYLKDYPYCL